MFYSKQISIFALVKNLIYMLTQEQQNVEYTQFVGELMKIVINPSEFIDEN